MRSDTESLLFTRRRLLVWAAGASALCGRIYAFASDFWNKKGSADWSSDEVHLMLTKSPWAKQVTAEVARSGGGGNRPTTSNGGNNTGMGTGGNSRAGGMGGMGGGGGNSRGGMGGMGGGSNNSGMGGGGGTPRAAGQQFKGIVRWESAKPVLEASKGTLPDAFAGQYVIAVINFPLGGRKADSDDGAQPKLSKAAQDRIKSATSLTVKGKDPAQPVVAQIMGNGLLLGFPKDSVKLSADDKEVAFATVIGRMNIKAKFVFKEMMYHETLAI